MTELIIGNGFVGQEVYKTFAAKSGDVVHRTSRHQKPRSNNTHYMDLQDLDSIAEVLDTVRPAIIINCAANTERSGGDVWQNPAMITNIFRAIDRVRRRPERIINLGSSRVYGPVDPQDLPVREITPLRATDPYAQSKIQETAATLRLGAEFRIPVAIGRLFNPIGPNLRPSYLLPTLLGQIEEIKAGRQKPVISVESTLAARDYVDNRDVADALWTLAHTPHLNHSVYNVGSGRRTTNQTLIEVVLENSTIRNAQEEIAVVGRRSTPEPPVGAEQAHIGRLIEIGWQPRHSLADTVRWIGAAATIPSRLTMSLQRNLP